MGDLLLEPPSYRGQSYPADVGVQINFMNNNYSIYPPYLYQYVQMVQPIWDSGKLYIIAGDDPQDVAVGEITSVIDAGTAAYLATTFQVIPRQLLGQWIDRNLKPKLDQTNWMATLRALWNYYNKVNNQYLVDINENVWVRELQKYDAWMKAYPDEVIPAVYKLDLAFIKKNVRNFAKSLYEDLDTIADFGLEYTRGAAFQHLLNTEEYYAAIAIVRAYANLEPGYIDILKKELPPDNNVVKISENAPILESDHPLMAAMTI